LSILSIHDLAVRYWDQLVQGNLRDTSEIEPMTVILFGKAVFE